MATAAASVKPKLRLLFLHGYGQCARTFRNQCRAVEKGFKRSQCEVEFLNAPYFAPPRDGVEKEDSRSWWITQELEDGYNYEGLDKSVTQIAEEISKDKDGGAIGIVGFSQGAGMASVIAALADRGDDRFGAVKCAFFVGGFVPRDNTLLRDLFPPDSSEPIYTKIPTLHLWGLEDPVVLPERSQALAELWKDPKIITHKGGHYFPSNGALVRSYRDWLEEEVFSSLEDPGEGKSKL